MATLKENIELMRNYDPCVRVSPGFLAQLLSGLLELADVTNLDDFSSAGSVLPKMAGAFTFRGYPVHQRAIEHNSTMYIVFCSYHNGTSGNSGCNYIAYQYDTTNKVFKFFTLYTSSTVVDWIKRAFNEATATATYPGLLSNTLYKKIDAMYRWCVSQGMAEVS